MLPTGPAIVILYDPPMRRAAALVFRTEKGVGWVEQGYWDDYPPASPQWHQFDGELLETELGAVLYREGNPILLFDANLVRGTQEDDPELRGALERLTEKLHSSGKTFASQRALLVQLLPLRTKHII